VSSKQCVPQRPDDGSWPVPKTEALVKSFNTEAFDGAWYIAAGLNRAFDTFDCQLHKFEAPAPNKLVGNLQWRIKDPVAGSNFATRYTVQEFIQDPEQPGILYNHDNEFLHYQDDWYIVGYKPDQYIIVYYRGSNDAWDGYGGAVIYTRAPSFPMQYAGEADEALNKIGLKFADFNQNDNSCKAGETKLEEIEADLQFVETKVAGGLQGLSKEVVKDATLLEKEVVRDAALLEKEAEKEVLAVEKVIQEDVEEVESGILGLFKPPKK